MCHKSDTLLAYWSMLPNHINAHFYTISMLVLLQQHVRQKWRRTEAHKSDPVAVACYRLLSQAANSIIRLIVSAINFNPDMKEFGGVYIANYSHSLRPVFKMQVLCQRLAPVDGV